MLVDNEGKIGMAGIDGQGYSSFGTGGPFKKALNQDNQSFLDDWASRSAIWGTRHGLGESLDRYLGLHRPAFASDVSKQFAELGIDSGDSFTGKNAGTLSYSNILKLESDHISWRDLSWKSFKDTVKENTKPLREHLKSASPKTFFQDISSKAYLKETLWEGNIKPFKELFSGSRQNLFMNLGYGVGVALSGASVVKTGIQYYRHWHQQEDGSVSSRLKTLYETGKATGQKTIQAVGSWEAASIGMAIGRALLPVGSIPIGGILVGGLLATTAYKAIGKLFSSLSIEPSEN